MRVMFNSQERTLRELAALTRSAGWKIVRVTRAEGSLFGHLIAIPIDIPPETLLLPEDLEGEESIGADESDAMLDTAPMGDTFLSSVELPSETAIREGVASGSVRLKAARGEPGKSDPARRRARSYTFTARDNRDKDRENRDAKGDFRKGFRTTIMKMLSKAHLRNDSYEEDRAVVEGRDEGEGRLALTRQLTRS